MSPKAQIKELEATSQKPAQPENTPKKDEKAATPCQGLQKDPSGSSNLGANVPETFEQLLKSESKLATAVAAIKTLMIVLDKCSAKTLQELIKLLREAVDQMKKEVDCSGCTGVQAGCELFLRFITTKLEEETFEAMRSKMLEKGNVFLEKMMTARLQGCIKCSRSIITYSGQFLSFAWVG